MQTIMDVTLSGPPFAIGYHSPQLHWHFVSSEPGTHLDTEVSPCLKEFNVALQPTSLHGLHMCIKSSHMHDYRWPRLFMQYGGSSAWGQAASCMHMDTDMRVHKHMFAGQRTIAQCTCTV